MSGRLVGGLLMLAAFVAVIQFMTSLHLDSHMFPRFGHTGTSLRKQSASVTVESQGCEKFKGAGRVCAIEYPEHDLVRKWIPEDAVVAEFGARYGTTTCEIAKKLKNSGKLIAVEPDHSVQQILHRNLVSNNCKAHVLQGVVGSKAVEMNLYTGYAAQTGTSKHDQNNASVQHPPVFSFEDAELLFDAKVDTLLIDCEGCAEYMMDQIGPKLKSQIKLVLLEADMPSDHPEQCPNHCMDYHPFFTFLKDNGFSKVDQFNDCDFSRSGAPNGTWCGPWIEHYAFRRDVVDAKHMDVRPHSVSEPKHYWKAYTKIYRNPQKPLYAFR
eukprot:gnl/TRDRNA2_/TRDRNA2_136979_c0_seq4.p1 gnl/TRDRNA2_/TRDRNA2_136979_c0~~gnl/TRDRNA2_/TRDRNA2_136979_c0_seq4.p1  ORF type:complete len:325 (-),score=27.92 gnl/TRDRNA2_/TRDRNA2_136979_c0_seq4:340-1314(-)